MLLVFYTFTRREVVLTTVSRSRQSGGKELSRRISADASHASYSAGPTNRAERLEGEESPSSTDVTVTGTSWTFEQARSPKGRRGAM